MRCSHASAALLVALALAAAAPAQCPDCLPAPQWLPAPRFVVIRPAAATYQPPVQTFPGPALLPHSWHPVPAYPQAVAYPVPAWHIPGPPPACVGGSCLRPHGW